MKCPSCAKLGYTVKMTETVERSGRRIRLDCPKCPCVRYKRVDESKDKTEKSS